MPVHVKHDLQRLTQDQFAKTAYRVMGHLFEIHRDFGRLFDEEIYQREVVAAIAGGARRGAGSGDVRLVLQDLLS